MLTFSTKDRADSYGNYFIVGLSGTALEESDKRVLGGLKPAGVLLLKRNFDHTVPYKEWISKLKKLLEDVHAYAERDKMIISLDHEGGRVHRVPPPLTLFPEAMQYRYRAAEVAKAMATEIKSIGVNLSWAPVVDIHSNPANPIIGNRAFGTTAQEVADNAIRFTHTLMAEGVLACAKHFPGHGDTETDSHLELPVVNASKQTLEARELFPFKIMAQENVPFMMTAHIIFQAIDSEWPATLSEKILSEILRNKFGYKGIIVSDDLDMKAVSKSFENDETLGKAFNAGCDMFIVARHPDGTSERPLTLGKFVHECLKKRVLKEERLSESFERIKRLFAHQVNKYEVKVLEQGILDSHSNLAKEILLS